MPYLANTMKALNLSDRELAKELGLSITTVRYLERPDAPKYLQLAVAALIAGLDPEEILSMDEPAGDKPLQTSREPLVV